MYKIALLLLVAVLAVASAQVITSGFYGSPYLRTAGYAPYGGLYRSGIYNAGLYRPYAYGGLTSGYYY